MTAVQSADTSGQRRQSNKKNAIQFATLGLAVFVSDGKVPLIPRYNKLDTDLSQADVEQAVADHMDKHDGQAPVHVGATKNIETIKKMFRRFPDAMPSIACGPSRLCVLDADAKDNGPELLGELFEEHGGVPAGVPVIPTQSGGKHFIFADPDGAFTNKAGLLKKRYGTDVRGTGGQFVAPGSIREDGRTYGTNDDKIAFLRAVNLNAIPSLPAFIADKIGRADRSDETVTHIREREVIQTLRDADHEAALEQFDPTLGLYDVEALKKTNAEFAALYDSPSDDCSTNRFLAARHVMTEWPDMPPEALAVFFGEWAGAGSFTDDKPRTGEYDDRQIAREWLKNQGLSKPSKGEAFGLVSDDDPTDKAAFLANGGTEERWEAWREQLTREREVRLARAGRAGDQTDGLQSASSGHGVLYFADIRKAEPKHLDWVIKYFVARGTTTIVSGIWGAGKTAAFLEAALHIAAGLPYRGRKVQKSVVVYGAFENPDDIQRRVNAWSDMMETEGRDISGAAFVIHGDPCVLYRADAKQGADEKRLISVALKASEHYELPVGLVILDTVSASIAPGNDREHGAIYVRSMLRIAKHTGAAVVAIHHPTKGGDAFRGDGAFQGDVDCTVLVDWDAKKRRGSIKAGPKFRIGDPSRVDFKYRRQTIEVGRDKDDDPIEVMLALEDTSPMPAVRDEDDESEPEQDIPPIRVSDTREDRVAALAEVAASKARELAAEGEGVTTIGLSAPMLRGAFNSHREPLFDLKGEALRPLNRQGFQRVLETAIEAGILRVAKSRYYLRD